MNKLKWEKFEPLFGNWALHFKPLFEEMDVMENIYAKLKEDGKKGRIICPSGNDTYRAFETCPPQIVNTIFILLDPYPTVIDGIMTSNGIAMDCSNRGKLQPSLEKFYEGIEEEYANGLDLKMLKPPSLDYLYNQGVMFLNSALTVEKDKTGSHTKLWEPFLKYFLDDVMSAFTGIIYVLAGKDSQKLKKYINPLGNYIFEMEHPSFAARQYREWEHGGIFKKINQILKGNNNMEIQWVLTDAPY